MHRKISFTLNNKTRFSVLVSICILLSSNIFAYDFSQETKRDLYDFRKTLFLSEQDFDFKSYIDGFEEHQKNRILSEQEKLVLSAEILIQRLNFVQDKRTQKETLLDMSDLQKEIKSFIQSEDDLSEYLLTAYADLASRLISNMSGGEMYRMSMESKQMYLEAISMNRRFAPAYSGYGNWLYFAPSVAGGGFNSALKQFSKAVKYSEEDFDLFINNIYLSQVYLKLGNKSACEKSMRNAEQIYPGNSLTRFIREKNEKGKCFFD